MGDDDQAIYGWRGADVRNILDFDEHFAGAKVVKLEQNYRSLKPVLDVANAVISRRTDSKHRKVLFTDRVGGDKVQSVIAASPEAEAQWVAMEIRKAVRDGGTPAREVAVLYRSNGQAKAIEEALREQLVPHRVVGGQQFFERKEVKDLLAYMKLALNRADEISLRRVMNYPPRGIGDASVEKLAQTALARGWSLWQAIERVDSIDAVSGPARDGCKALEKVVAETRRQLLAERVKPSEAARALCDRVGLRKEIEATSPSMAAAARRWANVDGMFGLFARREQRELAKGGTPPTASRLSFTSSRSTSVRPKSSPRRSSPSRRSTAPRGSSSTSSSWSAAKRGSSPTRARSTRAPPTSSPRAATTSPRTSRRSAACSTSESRAPRRGSRSPARRRASFAGSPSPRTPSRFLLEVPAELIEEREVAPEQAMTTAQITENANALLAALEALG